MPEVRTVRIRSAKGGRGHILQSLFFIFVFCLAAYVLLQSSLFRVREITVVGNKQLASNEIIRLTGITKDINIFKANLEQAAGRAALHPMIKLVDIKRDLPATIIIAVTERRPVGILPDRGAFIIVGDDGTYLRKTASLATVNLPIITGVKPVGMPGQKIADERLKHALNYLLGMSANMWAAVSEVNVSDINNIRVFTIDGVEVKFGDDSRVSEKIKLFQEVISQKYQNRILYINVSYKGRPVIKFEESVSQRNTRQFDTEIYD